MKTKRSHFARFGPAIPIVPVGDFSRAELTREQWEFLWSIVGPSVEKNMAQGWRNRQLELWQVIAAAYMEGLVHGHGIAQDKAKQSDNPGTPGTRVQAIQPNNSQAVGKVDDGYWDGIPCGP